MLVSPEATYSLCSKRVTRPARSELLAPPEASYSPRPKQVARPARSELLAPLEACCSPCSERVARPARSELLALLGASCSLHSKGIARCALSIRAAVLEPYQYSCSKSADSLALRVSPALLRTVPLHRTGRTGQFDFTDAIWFTVRFKFSLPENLSKKDFFFGGGRTELGSTPSPSGSAAFLPVDFRIGWQPGARKNRRFTFKLEAGLYGTTYSKKITDYYDTSKVLSKKIIFLVSPRTTIGLAVRF